MGQVYSNQSGSVKGYVLPPVPGGILGQSAALAYAQGARTPSEIASQGGYNFFMQIIGILVLVGLILFFRWLYTSMQKANFRNEQPLEPDDKFGLV